jgi:Ca2+-binding RTX toxin-like protein
MNLSALDGTNGFEIISQTPSDGFGQTLAAAGDVNGDGFADLIIGAPHAGAESFNVSYPGGILVRVTKHAGASYVVFGSATGFDADLIVSTLNGSNGFRISGGSGDETGLPVSSAGDVNGDGFDDLIVGATFANSYNSSFSAPRAGASYVIFGSGSGFEANIALSELDGANGFKIDGSQALGSAGRTVSAVGDLNGDGYDDLVLGTPNANLFDGAAYVMFGRASGFAANVNPAGLDGENGFRLVSDTGSGLGSAVSAAGDVNGDGIGDLLVFGDRVYVVFGKAGGGFSPSIEASSLNGASGFVFGGYSSGAVAGDVNGDGLQDLLFGNSLVFGRAQGAASLSSGALDGVNGFVITDGSDLADAAPYFTRAGDINGDGYDDLLGGALYAGETGAAFIVFGKASGFAAAVDLSTLSGTNGFSITGESEPGRLGAQISAAGDMNGDGIDDLMIGDWVPSKTYVIFGQASGFGSGLVLSALNGANGIVLEGAPTGLTMPGNDINGDGFDDILLRGNAGVYVVFGGDPTGATESEGTEGADFFTGDDDADVFLARGGGDTLHGGAGDDVLKGGSGDDWLGGGPGEDRLIGGLGFDIADFSGEAAEVMVDLATGRAIGASSGSDFLDGVECIIGSAHNDVLIGAMGSQLLIGGAGNDTLRGGGGDVFRIAPGDGTDLITNFSRGDFIDVAGVEIQQGILKGNGSTVLAGQVQLSSQDGITTLYIGTNSTAGADLLVRLEGAFGAPNLRVEDGNISVEHLPVAIGFGSSFNLSAINGVNGFKISGGTNDGIGYETSVGDVNGDGILDILIGGGYGINKSGGAYLVFGQASGFQANLNVSELNGANGFSIPGEATYDAAGGAVSAAGDFNGDGYDDLLIGAAGRDVTAFNGGGAYVVFGKSSGFSANLNLSGLNGVNGFEINGEPTNILLGQAVAAGDINADGFDDLLIGSSDRIGTSSVTGPGATYVVFGHASGFSPSLNLSSLNGVNGFEIKGTKPGDFLGNSVAAAGDVNNDGFQDILVGAVGHDFGRGDFCGAAYLVYGRAGGFPAEIIAGSLTGATGVQIVGGIPNSRVGHSVAGAGDVNGDGYDDFLVGVPEQGLVSNLDEGHTYLIYGGTLEMGAVIRGNIGSASAGSVSGAGDVNGDGFDDLLIGAVQEDFTGNQEGVAYVVYGSAAGVEDRLSDIDGTNGFKLFGEAPFDGFGMGVSAAGDVNGDGYDDILVGASGHGDGGTGYVVYGGDFSRIVDSSGTAGNDLILGDDNVNVYVTGAGNDTLDGIGGNDVLKGGHGDDRLIGGAGLDRLFGGMGFDFISYESEPDQVTVDLALRRASGVSSGADLLEGIEGVIGSALADRMIGGAGAEALLGGNGNDMLGGAAGDDTLEGGDGDDTLDGDWGNDTIDGGAGHDTINGGLGNDSLVGGFGDDVFIDKAGDDRLSGGDGDDTFLIDYAASAKVTATGGAGRDTFALEPITSDFRVTDFDGGAGGDRIDVSAITDKAARAGSYTGTDPFATGHLRLVKSGNHTLVRWDLDGSAGTVHSPVTGMTLLNVGPSSIELSNFMGLVVGKATAESLAGSGDNDILLGLGGNDLLSGAGGDDQLFGGTGADTLRGGVGSDTYQVDSAGDKVIELDNAPGALVLPGAMGAGAAGTGSITDTVIAAINYSLNTTVLRYIENVQLTGNASRATGNALHNELIGNAGSDTLSGGAGHDTLDGGAGADSMIGGNGNDVYAIDSASDRIKESENQGVDTIRFAITGELGASFEHLVLTGSKAINGTGNGVGNNLTGNSAKNRLVGKGGDDWLDGGRGNDTLEGGAGNDIYVVDSVLDKVTEFSDAGTDDIVRSSVTLSGLSANVEHLVLVGSSSINGTGNGRANRITGNDGHNVLVGGGGSDSLEGGAGNDTLIWDAADAVIDGGEGQDTLRLAGGGEELDLTLVDNALIERVEILDIAGTGANLLILEVQDLLDISLTGDILTIKGDADDAVSVTDGIWSHVEEAGGYNVYTEGIATLRISVEIGDVVISLDI